MPVTQGADPMRRASPGECAEAPESLAQAIWPTLLDAAGIRKGSRFFDAACGTGGLCALAAAQGAEVCGLEESEALVAEARQCVPQGDFRVGSPARIPYGRGAFDVVFAVNALTLAPDPRAAFAELRRVLARNASLVLAQWGSPEECDLFTILCAASDKLLPRLAEFGFSAAGDLEELVERAGLRVVIGGGARVPFCCADAQTAWKILRETASLRRALATTSEETLKVPILQALEMFRSPEGEIRLHNRLRYLAATA